VQAPRKGEAFPHSGAAEPLVGTQPLKRNLDKPTALCPYARPRTILLLRYVRRTGIESGDSARTGAANFRIRVERRLQRGISIAGEQC